MKANKPTQRDEYLVTRTKHFLPSKRILSYYAPSRLETLADCHTLLKKNYFSTKLKLLIPDKHCHCLFRRIMKRNAKYLKKSKPFAFEYHHNVDFLKHAKSLKVLDLHLQFYDEPHYYLLFQQGLNTSEKLKLKTIKLIVRRIFKTSFLLNRLKSGVNLFNYRFVKYFQGLSKLKGLDISDSTYYPDPNVKPSLSFKEALANVSHLKRLSSVTLDFIRFTREEDFQDLYYEIFEKLSDLENLACLKIAMVLNPTKKVYKMKKIMEKFRKLTYLFLDLNLEGNQDWKNENKDFGNIFTNLMPLTNLRTFMLRVRCSCAMDCSDLAKFLPSLKNLTGLKIFFEDLVYIGWDAIIKSIQKLKNLQILSLLHAPYFYQTYTFAYGLIFKTIQMLKNLSSIHIDLGKYSFEPSEMENLVKNLVTHPKLEKVTIGLIESKDQKGPYELSDDFYQGIVQLVSKLKRLKIKTRFVQEPIRRKIEKIIENNGDSKYYTCVNWPIFEQEEMSSHNHRMYFDVRLFSMSMFGIKN